MKLSKIVYMALLIVSALFCHEAWARGHGGGQGSGGFRGHSGGHGAGSFRGHGGGHGSGGFYGHSGVHRYGGFHGHSGFGFYFGSPFYSYPFYPYPYYRYPYAYPYYYPPAVVTVPSTPPVYIEQSKPVTREYPTGYWYYCDNPEGYYPYVKECPDGWQQVDPAPSAPR